MVRIGDNELSETERKRVLFRWLLLVALGLSLMGLGYYLYAEDLWVRAFILWALVIAATPYVRRRMGID